MSPERDKQMTEIMRSLRRALKHLCVRIDCGKEIESLIFDLPKRRSNTKLLRAYFVQKISLYINELARNENKKLRKSPNSAFYAVQIPFIAEIILCLQYSDNQIFDKKFNIVTGEKIRNNILSHNLLERILNDYVDKLPLSKTIRKHVRKSLDLTDIGQFIEGKYNLYDYFKNCNERHTQRVNKLPTFSKEVNDYLASTCFYQVASVLKRITPRAYQNFVHLYLLRISLTSSALFVEFSKMILDLKGYKGKNSQKIIDYAYLLGLVLQIVNDINDHIPAHHGYSTVAKESSDGFSDIKNGNITLPIALYLLNIKKELNYDALQNLIGKNLLENEDLYYLGDKSQGKIFDIALVLNDNSKIEVHEEESVLLEIAPILKHYAMPIVRILAKQARNNLDLQFPAGMYLDELLEVAETNKYYRIIEDSYQSAKI